MNIVMNIQDWEGTVPMPTILKPRPIWTGKQVFSMFLPDVNVKRTSAWHKDNDLPDMSNDDSQVSEQGWSFPQSMNTRIPSHLRCPHI